MTKPAVKYTKARLEHAVKRSRSYAGVLRLLGVKLAGGNQSHLKSRILLYEIDTSHFTGQGHRKGKASNLRRSAKSILVKQNRERREDAKRLRRALLEIGRRYVCEKCGCDGQWQNTPLTLHIDHKNGDWTDNTEDNLRFLCPNCHSQTDTFGRRSSGETVDTADLESVASCVEVQVLPGAPISV